MKKLIVKAVFFLITLATVLFYNLTGEPQGIEVQEEVLTGSPEIPQLQTKRKEQVIRHEGFTVSYNSDYRIANWVAYELTSEKAKSNNAQRSEVFLPDPNVKGPIATDYDYRRSGYDRGHLAPAGDMKWSKTAMDATFYFSNICPQDRQLNSGLWHDLEKLCRRWSAKHDKLLIVTGPVIEDRLKRIGNNKVAVPRNFYKVICSVSDNRVEGIGFIFENRNYTDTSLRSLAIPIDSVEVITGIDFYPSFPEEIQSQLESAVNWGHWGLR